MDDVFDWSANKQFTQVPTGVEVAAMTTHTWELTHDLNEMQRYPLPVGTHSLIGEVVGYETSDPIEFKVIPEPSCMCILALGGEFLRRRARRFRRQCRKNSFR